MVSSLKKYLIVVVLLSISFTLGYYAKPAKVEVKTVEKIIKDSREKGTIDEREIINKDGSKTITRKIKYEETTKESTEKKTTEKYQGLPNNLITVQRRLDNTIQNSNTVGYQRRIFSSLYFGVYGEIGPNPGYGLSLTLGF